MIYQFRELKLLLLKSSLGLLFEELRAIKRNFFKFTAEQQRFSIRLSKLLTLPKLFFFALAFYSLNTVTIAR